MTTKIFVQKQKACLIVDSVQSTLSCMLSQFERESGLKI